MNYVLDMKKENKITTIHCTLDHPLYKAVVAREEISKQINWQMNDLFHLP